jgi:hypothetical protein
MTARQAQPGTESGLGMGRPDRAQPHHSFGSDLVGQTYEADLTQPPGPAG